MSENICKECGKPCDITTTDEGIGAYEYWGATGVDVRICHVSSCCEADFEGEVPEPDFAEPDYDNYDYEEV